MAKKQKEKEPFGTRGYAVVANDPRAQAIINETLRDTGSGELEIYNPDGTLVPFMLQAESIEERDTFIVMLNTLYKISLSNGRK